MKTNPNQQGSQVTGTRRTCLATITAVLTLAAVVAVACTVHLGPSGAGSVTPRAAADTVNPTCAALRAQFGPGWPCISVPSYTPTTSLPTAPTAPTGNDNSGNANMGVDAGPGPGEGNGTPIVPVPGMAAPPAVPPAPSVPADVSPLHGTPAPAEVPTPTGVPTSSADGRQPRWGAKPGDCGTDELPLDNSPLTHDQESAYERLDKRAGTYGARRRQVIQEIRNGKWPGINPSKFHLDHIVALNRLVRIPGFTELSPEAQDAIANSPANTRPLPGPWNTSKQEKSYAVWPMKNTDISIAPPDQETWKKLCEEEKQATQSVLGAVDQALVQKGEDQGRDGGTDGGEGTDTGGGGSNKPDQNSGTPTATTMAQPDTQQPTDTPTAIAPNETATTQASAPQTPTEVAPQTDAPTTQGTSAAPQQPTATAQDMPAPTVSATTPVPVQTTDTGSPFAGVQGTGSATADGTGGHHKSFWGRVGGDITQGAEDGAEGAGEAALDGGEVGAVVIGGLLSD